MTTNDATGHADAAGPGIQAALIAGAGLVFAGCDDDGHGKFLLPPGATADGFSGVLTTQPAAPASATEATASRFLQQSTFGATTAEIDLIVQIGFDEWFTRQAR